MPVYRTVKKALLEAIFIITVMAAVGHLSVNLWERFVIQSELSQMKLSLHFLKRTIANIGNAYDKLDADMKVLSEITKNKDLLIKQIMNGPEKPYKLEPQRLHDIEVNTITDITKDIANYISKNEAKEFLPNTNRKDEQNCKTKIDNKYQFINFPSKVSAKDEIMNIPSTRNAKIETMFHQKKTSDKALTYPIKANVTDVSCNLAINDTVKYVNKMVNIETKSEANQADHVVTVNTITMTRYPLKSTGTGCSSKSLLENYIPASYDIRKCEHFKCYKAPLWNI